MSLTLSTCHDGGTAAGQHHPPCSELPEEFTATFLPCHRCGGIQKGGNFGFPDGSILCECCFLGPDPHAEWERLPDHPREENSARELLAGSEPKPGRTPYGGPHE